MAANEPARLEVARPAKLICHSRAISSPSSHAPCTSAYTNLACDMNTLQAGSARALSHGIASAQEIAGCRSGDRPKQRGPPGDRTITTEMPGDQVADAQIKATSSNSDNRVVLGSGSFQSLKKDERIQGLAGQGMFESTERLQNN